LRWQEYLRPLLADRPGQVGRSPRRAAGVTSRAVPPPPPARSPSLPAPSPSLSRPAASGRDRSEDRPNAIRCSTPSAAFTCSSSASQCAASSRSRAFSARSSSASRASCQFASSACSSASSGGASAPVSASTPAATATEHSEHPRKPGITHPRPTCRATVTAPRRPATYRGPSPVSDSDQWLISSRTPGRRRPPHARMSFHGAPADYR
jgi:hypothetical protein